ncbi:GxxExxY protein [candidate division KSB1 bacterium]|nr:GxxExxY protein [candidate division KSB1 bacterium]NIR72274.1 GxxExxY protein [candidate division KSB1 bacterium]NIS24245.1 GxxExxY protein [candidate division KSB1 bacterium]NIT71160.1 GxxExxY protein [candidate division KSB1 bacterium]NIU24864.1 GxxExxY protein [candidate division KSB1 bacterium]
MEDILYKRLSDETIGACIEVHKLMGLNLSERIYEACPQEELIKRGCHAERQKWIVIFFKGEKLDEQYKIDMFGCEQTYSTVPDLDDSHLRQPLTYLEASIYEVGYVIKLLTRVFEISTVGASK